MSHVKTCVALLRQISRYL